MNFRLRRLAESDGVEILEEEEEEEEEKEPEPETLKYANRSGSYALCQKAGIGIL